MKIEQAKSLIDLIRDASPANITIVSLVILPILFAAWTLLLNNIPALDAYPTVKGIILATLLVVYIGGVLYMKLFESAKDKRARAAKHIRNRLEHRKRPLGSFDYIRRHVNSDYTDNFLFTVLDEFPDDFRRARIKSGKPGIALNEPNEDSNA